MKKLLAVIMGAVMVLSAAACSAKSETPDKAVSNYIDAVKANDLKTASKYVDTDYEEPAQDENEQQAAMTQALLDSLSYTIVSTEENGDTATVKAKIKSIDMSAVMTDYITDALSQFSQDITEEDMEAKMFESFSAALEKNSSNLTEREVDIQLTKGESNWIITMNDELADALTGGMLTIAAALSGAAQ